MYIHWIFSMARSLPPPGRTICIACSVRFSSPASREDLSRSRCTSRLIARFFLASSTILASRGSVSPRPFLPGETWALMPPVSELSSWSRLYRSSSRSFFRSA